MNTYTIEIKWEGPYSTDFVISKMGNGGNKLDGYSGSDYGLYQIYGNHILCKEDTLLYVGETTQRTFFERFKEHKEWLDMEKDVKIYLGRIDDNTKYSEIDNWDSWKKDVKLAERIIIHKYSPHYNSLGISEPPEIPSSTSIKLIHNNNAIEKDKMHKLHPEDNAPQDWEQTAVRPRE